MACLLGALLTLLEKLLLHEGFLHALAARGGVVRILGFGFSRFCLDVWCDRVYRIASFSRKD